MEMNDPVVKLLQAKHRWFRKMYLFMDVGNKLKNNSMPPIVDDSGNLIKIEVPDFEPYMMCLHAIIFYGMKMLSKANLKRIYDKYKTNIDNFLKALTIKDKMISEMTFSTDPPPSSSS